MDVKLKQFAASRKTVKLVLAAGIVGIALILLSEFLPESRQTSVGGERVATTSAAENEAERIGKRLEEVISAIEGVGSAKVLITLESGSTNIYAQEKKAVSDTAENVGSGSEKKLEQKESTEDKYIFVEDENGRRQALLITTVEPVVKGVVIICDGAEDPKVRLRVLNAVTVALEISSARVSIEKMA